MSRQRYYKTILKHMIHVRPKKQKAGKHRKLCRAEVLEKWRKEQFT